MSIKLRLESATDSLDLNSILSNGYGYQALAGLTGLGLPPVTVQWAEGAGDGAQYRSRRVRSRDIDIPLDFVGIDRNELKTLLSRLAKVLSAEATLVIEEPDGTEWYAKVARTGGGGIVYGEDTTGQSDLQMVLTLRAGDPYFTSVEVNSVGVQSTTSGPFLTNMVELTVSPSQAAGQVVVENTGDAEAYPIWTVTGPGNTFKAISPTGETLRWNGTLLAGETLTLDTRTGTVIDGTSANRYADLASAPRFWTLPPGVTYSEASLLGTTSASKITCAWRTRKWSVI